MLHLPKKDNELCLRYLKSNWPDAYSHLTVAEFERQPYYKRVWIHWQALAYFNIGNHYVKLEDAPDGLEWINVMDSIGPQKNYTWRDGKYVFIQEFSLDLCKATYEE